MPRHLFILKLLCIYIFIFGCAEPSLFLFADFSLAAASKGYSSPGARTSPPLVVEHTLGTRASVVVT